MFGIGVFVSLFFLAFGIGHKFVTMLGLDDVFLLCKMWDPQHECFGWMICFLFLCFCYTLPVPREMLYFFGEKEVIMDDQEAVKLPLKSCFVSGSKWNSSTKMGHKKH